MNRQQQVMLMLKPKVKAFGFNKKELQGIAAKIADNLTSKEDASDEDVNAEIEDAIEAVLPILEVGRSYANRVINTSKNDDKNNDEDEDSDEETSSSKSTKTKSKKSDEMPEWAQQLLQSNESMKAEINALKGEKVTNSRRAKLEGILKGTDTFGNRILKSFAKMQFESDDDFNEFCAEVEEDLKSYNQERANNGLSKLSPPAGGGSKKEDDKEIEVLSEDEVKAIAMM